MSSSRPMKGTTLEIGQQFGSFGRLNNTARVSYATDKYFIKLRTSWDRADNNFSFRNTTKAGAPVENQENAAYEQIGFDLESGINLGKDDELVVSLQYVDMDRQIQPSMNVEATDDFQNDNNLRLRTRYTHNGKSSSWYLQYAFLADQIDYNGSRTNADQHVMKANFEHRLGEKYKLSLAADHSIVGVEAEFYNGGNVSETRSNIWGSLLAMPTSWLTLSANLRQGFHPIYQVPLSPSLGAEVRLNESADWLHPP